MNFPLYGISAVWGYVSMAMKAYFLRGSRGVKITTLNEKQYLIGSDQPEELNAVMKAFVKTNGIVP